MIDKYGKFFGDESSSSDFQDKKNFCIICLYFVNLNEFLTVPYQLMMRKRD